MYYAEASKAKRPELHFEIVYDVVRHERLTLGIYSPHLEAVKLSDRAKKGISRAGCTRAHHRTAGGIGRESD